MPETNLKQTVLHPRHRELGAKLAPFGGWDMPLWYRAGAVREHLAVIQAAGLFDTGHMDVVFVTGPGSHAFLDAAFTRSLSGHKPNRAVYGAFLDAAGHCLDDAVIYPLGEWRHAIVANAGMGTALVKHLRGLPGADSLVIAEPEERLAKLDVQGPESYRLVRNLFPERTAAELFADFPYFSFRGDFDLARSALRLADGSPALLSRSGYTGELGFELFTPVAAVGAVWDRLLDLGRDAGVLPCGLAARDSLRTGAVLPLSHQDIGPWPFINHPWRIALPLAADGSFTKDFVGADALDPAVNPHTLPFTGFDARRVDPGAAEVVRDGKAIGKVLTIVSDMAIDRLDGRVVGLASPDRPPEWRPRGLACGFVRIAERLPAGTEIILGDGRREIRVEVVDDIRPARTARKKLSSDFYRQ